MSEHDTYLIVHGHFYQPPRENPWIETIEREPGAEPFDNWNARIADECYYRNGRARVFNDAGKVTQLVNNYEHLSFNFGPTLLSWMAAKAPDMYKRVLAADRASVAARGGHGNAIAQGYGHAILPLCDDRDRRTQIRWGKRDFAFRFQREAEAMWLPETAICARTTDALIDEGMRYVILAPRQCASIRPLDDGGARRAGDWQRVGDRVDPRVPYRVFARDGKRYIDAFFYDGPVSHAVSFEGLLKSSDAFVGKLLGAVDQAYDRPQLVHTAVDGETFGHHQRHAERALAYALDEVAERRGLRVTNYGEFLDLHPPTHEAQLQLGPGAEGSAWSCAHGVGRWARDCGCHASAPLGWNQRWREPLRAAVDFVRDQAAEIFEDLGGVLLADVWAARDDYVDVLLDPSQAARSHFLNKHGKNGASSNPTRVLQLCEMQRHALLSQTSCGWFFNDISGLEAVQVMRYAARSVQLMEELSGRVVEPGLLEILGEARSNISEEGTGADIYRHRVMPAAVDRRRIVAQHAITDVLERHPDEYDAYGFRIRRLHRREMAGGAVRVCVGRVQVEHGRTAELADLTYALLHFGSHDFHCAVRPFSGQQTFRGFTEEIQRIFEQRSASVTRLLRAIDAHFGDSYFGLEHLLAEERERLLATLFGHLDHSIGQLYGQLYDMHSRNMHALVEAGLNMPREFRMAAEYTLGRRLVRVIEAQQSSLDPKRYAEALSIVEEAHAGGYNIDKTAAESHFGEMLERLTGRLVAGGANLSPGRVHDIMQLLELARHLELSLPVDRSQDLVFALIEQHPDTLDRLDVALLDGLEMAPLVPETSAARAV